MSKLNDVIPTERSERRNPPKRKTEVVALGDPSTKSLCDFAFGTAQDDICNKSVKWLVVRSSFKKNVKNQT